MTRRALSALAMLMALMVWAQTARSQVGEPQAKQAIASATSAGASAQNYLFDLLVNYTAMKERATDDWTELWNQQNTLDPQTFADLQSALVAADGYLAVANDYGDSAGDYYDVGATALSNANAAYNEGLWQQAYDYAISAWNAFDDSSGASAAAEDELDNAEALLEYVELILWT